MIWSRKRENEGGKKNMKLGGHVITKTPMPKVPHKGFDNSYLVLSFLEGPAQEET